MLVQPELEYPPDEATLKLCLLYTDLDQFDLAQAQAMKLESRMTREAQLARIARFRQAPDDPDRDRRLLGSVIPRDGRVPQGRTPRKPITEPRASDRVSRRSSARRVRPLRQRSSRFVNASFVSGARMSG
jgi:hypothetical protein